jgi:uncharacterized damage-inducible protein DinB
MHCYGAKELAEAFRTVRKNTIIIAEEVPEEHYGFRPAPETRTVALTLTHIALMTRFSEQFNGAERPHTLEGFDFQTFRRTMMADEQTPRSKAQIIELLREGGDRFAKLLEGLSEDILAERVTFPAGAVPPSKTRFELLMGVKEHEMHHRGQLMMMERMLGIVPHLTREFQARMAAMSDAKQ